MRAVPPKARPGFTLVELLVVIGIICVLAAVGYMTLPSLAGDYNRTRSIDALSEWLLTAKMRAKRDGTGTGIRLTPDASGNFSQVTYVQQPEPLTGGTCTGITNGVATFNGIDLVGPGSGPGAFDSLVQPGDYLEIQGGGAVHLIGSVQSSTQLTLANTNVNVTVPAGPISNFRILRSPRVLVGEDIKSLPANLAVNIGASLNIPQRNVPASGSAPSTTFYEILFAPSGSIIGQGTGAGKVILYVQDYNPVGNPGEPTLIVIDVRSGFIGAFPVGPPGQDPFYYTYTGAPGGL